MMETAEQYTARLLGNIGDGNPIKQQAATATQLKQAIRGLDKKQLHWRPGKGKWSIAEILAHLADAETVGAWRLRQIIASDGSAIQPYDQDAWASAMRYQTRDAQESLALYATVRAGNLALLKRVPKALWNNYGQHAERGKETITHMLRMYAGHDINHIQQVRAIAEVVRAKARFEKSAPSAKKVTK